MFYESSISPSVTVKSEDSGCSFLTYNRDNAFEGADMNPCQPVPNVEFRLRVDSTVEQVRLGLSKLFKVVSSYFGHSTV